MIKSYKLFTMPACSKCPAVKEHMQTLELNGEVINAGDPEGMQEARKHSISTVPTAIFFDEQGNIVSIAHDKEEVDKVIEKHK